MSFGCYKPGQAPVAGVEVNTQCYIRMTRDFPSNTADQVFTPITLPDQTTDFR